MNSHASLPLLSTLPVSTAGAYIRVDGLFVFALGWRACRGALPVVRVGGHVEGAETGWQCAEREAAEETGLRIRPVSAGAAFTSIEDASGLHVSPVEWETPAGQPRPVLAAPRPPEFASLSVMYWAEADGSPAPSGEVKSLLLLDRAAVARICRASLTLAGYLAAGGKAILHPGYDHALPLVPFLQLRALNLLPGDGF